MSECIQFVAEKLSDIGGKGKCICCLVCTVLITTLVCISVSIEGIEPTEYGLVKDNISQQITGDVYDSGLQWVGITNSVIRYPKVIQAVEFSDVEATRKSGRLRTRTKEGLEIAISCAFQYQLIKDDLPKIYRNFENDFEQKFIRIARAVILSGVSDWNSFDFWKKRKEVGDYIRKRLRIEFRKSGAKVVHFNLMKIDLPGAFDDAIIRTQVMVQDFIKYTRKQEVEKIKREIENVKAAAERRIVKINGQAQRDAQVKLEETKGEIAAQNIRGMEQQIKMIEDELFPPKGGYDNNLRKDDIMQFYTLLKIESLDDHTTARLFVDIDKSKLTTIN